MAERIEVATLGRCTVGGAAVASRRAIELAALLALQGGRAQRDWVTVSLFETAPAPSSLPTLAMRARKAGIPVEYERLRGCYRLEKGASFDVVRVLKLLDEGRVSRALDLYTGPFLPKSGSPFAVRTRANLEDRIVRSVVESGDVSLMTRADRLVKHPELSEELVRRGADTATVSLSRTWLSVLKAVG
ncbi:hypothetical protein [Nocardiopsis valliformis]|uniref:hypothetical protein n=1 Tax=Nocardiopsis valliformis TaxID=239974 RepID=UPI0003465E55|nr:hypothetical protein [Nocardiopsis valliformis]